MLTFGLTAFSALLYIVGGTISSPVCIYAAAALSTALYQIAIRAGIYLGVNKCCDKFDPNSRWLRQKKWEHKFYNMIRLHSIKNLLPPYCSIDFKKDADGAIRATCVTEISNAIIIPLSYLPTLFCVLALGGTEYVIPLTAIGFIMGSYDLIMLFAQRYNRFRMIDVFNRRQSRRQ